MGTMSRMVRLAGDWGGYRLASLLCRNQPRILMYHRFAETPQPGFCSREAFEWQVRYIRDHYHPMTLADLTQRVHYQGQVPSNAVVITVDDGYEDFFHIAAPVLKSYNVPATVFVATGFIDGRLWLWPDQVTWVLERGDSIPDRVPLSGKSFVAIGVTESDRKRALWSGLIEYLLAIPDRDKHQEIARLASLLGVQLPQQAPEGFRAMSWRQLEQLQEEGIEIGGHTQTHPTLGQVDAQQARTEIFGTRDELSRHLGEAARTFCYPNGQPSDFQDFLPGLVAEAGFIGAVTAFADNAGVSDRWAMRRHAGAENRFQFLKSVSGVEYLGHRLRRMPRLI